MLSSIRSRSSDRGRTLRPNATGLSRISKSATTSRSSSRPRSTSTVQRLFCDLSLRPDSASFDLGNRGSLSAGPGTFTTKGDYTATSEIGEADSIPDSVQSIEPNDDEPLRKHRWSDEIEAFRAICETGLPRLAWDWSEMWVGVLTASKKRYQSPPLTQIMLSSRWERIYVSSFRHQIDGIRFVRQPKAAPEDRLPKFDYQES